MRGTPLIAIGVILAIFGAVALGWQKISYTTRDTVIDVGPVKVMADNKKDMPLSPILGGVALAGGAGLIVAGARTKP